MTLSWNNFEQSIMLLSNQHQFSFLSSRDPPITYN
jgi:hypothetical protein